MRTTWIITVTLFIIVFIIDLAISQSSAQTGNPNTDKNVTGASDTTNNLNALDKPTGINTGTKGPLNNGNVPSSPTKRPNRRRPRRRRLRRRRKNRKGGKTRQKPKPTVPTKKKQDTSIDSFLSDGSTLDTTSKEAFAIVAGTKTVKETKIRRKKKPTKKPKSDQYDSFFDFFDVTTTVKPDTNAAPPTFDPNAKPGKKVLPTLDMSKAVTYDGRPCNETYKPHATIKTKYMMKFAEKRWETLSCAPNLGSGLVWRMDLCACGEELVPQDPDDWCGLQGYNAFPENKHKYIRRHHGADALMECAASLVWSQKKCECLYDSTVIDRPIEQRVTFVCKTILHLEFEGNLTNSADGYLVRPVPFPRRGRLPRIRYIETRGATGKAAVISSQPLAFQAYQGNDFQTQVTYSLNFKIPYRHRKRRTFMTLLTDECLRNYGGKRKERKPSFSLTFQPISRSFRLQFRTNESEVDQIVKGAEPDSNQWYKTVVYLEDSTLNLENNGINLLKLAGVNGGSEQMRLISPVFISLDAQSLMGDCKIPQNKCQLYIAGRGRGFDRSEDFYGYMDNVFLVKDCKFHEANIKIL